LLKADELIRALRKAGFDETPYNPMTLVARLKDLA